MVSCPFVLLSGDRGQYLAGEKMQVSIDRHNYVSIQSTSFLGTFVDLTLSPAEASELLHRLEEKKAQILDLATNYEDCHDCGSIHLKGRCPNLRRSRRA